MAKLINLSTPECGINDGLQISFRAPFDCSDVTGVTIDGVTYALVDASGESLSGSSKCFAKNAILTVIIDTINKKANLLNPRVNTHTKTLGTPEDTGDLDGSTVWAVAKQSAVEIKNIKNGSTRVPKATHANEADESIKLATARKINGVAFDGTSDITLPSYLSAKTPIAKSHLLTSSSDGEFIEFRGYGKSELKGLIQSVENPSIFIGAGNLADMQNGTYDLLSNGLASPYSVTLNRGHIAINKKAHSEPREVSSNEIMQYTSVVLQKGAYTLSFSNVKTKTFGTCGLYVMYDGTYVIEGATVSNNYTLSISIDKTTTVKFGFHMIDTETYSVDGSFECDVMLNVGTNVLPFSHSAKTQSLILPYTLRSADNIKDEIVIADGKVQIIKRTNERIFDGSADELWACESGGFRITLSDISTIEFSSDVAYFVCDKYTQDDGSNLPEIQNKHFYGRTSYFGYGAVVFKNNDIEYTTDAWRTYLASNPIKLVYTLAKDEVIDITDTEVGKALLELHTNAPSTTIITDCDCYVQYSLPSQKELDYDLLNNRPITGDAGDYQMDGNLTMKGGLIADSVDAPNLYGTADYANYQKADVFSGSLTDYANSMTEDGTEFKCCYTVSDLPDGVTSGGYAEFIKWGARRKIIYHQANSNRVFTRLYNTGVWFSWVELITSDDIAQIKEELVVSDTTVRYDETLNFNFTSGYEYFVFIDNFSYTSLAGVPTKQSATGCTLHFTFSSSLSTPNAMYDAVNVFCGDDPVVVYGHISTINGVNRLQLDSRYLNNGNYTSCYGTFQLSVTRKPL